MEFGRTGLPVVGGISPEKHFAARTPRQCGGSAGFQLVSVGIFSFLLVLVPCGAFSPGCLLGKARSEVLLLFVYLLYLPYDCILGWVGWGAVWLSCSWALVVRKV